MKKRAEKIIVALILFIISTIFTFNNILIKNYTIVTNNCIYIISYLIVGISIIKKAIRNIFRGKVFDENFLMTIATVGAICIGEFPEATAVMLFYQIGELFQSYAVNKSRKSISNLMNIRPDYANVIRENDIVEKVSPDEVKINEHIIVKPGEKVPLDGIIVEGESMVDMSALTGESVPKKVQVNDEILSGCINQNKLLKIKVTKEFGESTVSKILDLVENASNKKSKSENFITKFAKYYTPTVVIIALILAIFPVIIIKNANFFEWLYRALSFLVVSCPCALVISIPLSFFGGIGGASKNGILVKGSNYLEALSKVGIIVFDKTGTLTEGVFEVQKIKAVNISENELIKLSAHAEGYCNHPIALSIKKKYNEKIYNNLILKVEELTGLGISATVENKNILLGNEKLMKKYDIKYEICKENGTIIYVAINNEFSGYIVISDKIKKDSKVAIQNLKKNNIRKTIMLTGDKSEVGKNVAEQLEIDEVYAELLPDGKVKKLEEIMKGKLVKEKLVFVGDGINDAPVLSLADIGIAMGGIGTDAAIEAADIVIMNDEISKINSAIKISRKTMKIVRENIIFAISIKIIVLILTALGISTMWQAVFADVGVSVIAILNSLRMLNCKNI